MRYKLYSCHIRMFMCECVGRYSYIRAHTGYSVYDVRDFDGLNRTPYTNFICIKGYSTSDKKVGVKCIFLMLKMSYF